MDGYHLWSERYDRDLEDVFAVQDEIAESIVKALRVVLTDEEKRAIEQPRSENIEAYEYYLRGRQFFYQFREKGLQFARRMFTRAIEIDPDYARAYAGIADCSSQLYKYWDASAANLEQAETASRKALELAPISPSPMRPEGFALTLGGHHEQAKQEFETAIRLNPKLYEAYLYYANARFAEGKHEEAARPSSRLRRATGGLSGPGAERPLLRRPGPDRGDAGGVHDGYPQRRAAQGAQPRRSPASAISVRSACAA